MVKITDTQKMFSRKMLKECTSGKRSRRFSKIFSTKRLQYERNLSKFLSNSGTRTYHDFDYDLEEWFIYCDKRSIKQDKDIFYSKGKGTDKIYLLINPVLKLAELRKRIIHNNKIKFFRYSYL